MLAVIIDFHTHVFSPAVKNDRGGYAALDPHFAELYSSPKAKIITADELISAMDRYGIDVSVILNFHWSNQELCIRSNDNIIESVARYPGRLAGFCTANIESGDGALKEIERCASAGIRGIGELRPARRLLGNTAIMRPFAEVLKKYSLILLTHASEPVGHQYPGKGDITPDVLYPLFTAYPDLTIVCAHWGGGLPFYALMPEVKQAMKNVYFDTAASPFLYEPQIYSRVRDLVGTDKILFGSDYPVLTPARLLGEIHSLHLSPQGKDLILAGNAQRILGRRG